MSKNPVWVSQTFSPRAAALWISWPTKSFIKPAESGHGPMRGRVFVLLPKKHYRHRNKFQWHLGRVKRGGFDQVAFATNLVGRKLHKTGTTLSRINERESLCLASSKGIIVIVIQWHSEWVETWRVDFSAFATSMVGKKREILCLNSSKLRLVPLALRTSQIGPEIEWKQNWWLIIQNLSGWPSSTPNELPSGFLDPAVWSRREACCGPVFVSVYGEAVVDTRYILLISSYNFFLIIHILHLYFLWPSYFQSTPSYLILSLSIQNSAAFS